MWLMLQQEKPEDFVIASGEIHSLEEFAEAAFTTVGLDWRDHVVLDPSLLRLVDLVAVRANPANAREKLGWQARYKMHDIVRMMLKAQSTSEIVI